MKHQQRASYPAPAGVVLKMFSDLGYQRNKLTALGIEFEILDFAQSPASTRLKARRFIPMQVSGIAARILPKTTVVVNNENWDLVNQTGWVEVTTQGVPLALECTARFESNEESCEIVYDWDIKAKLPMGAGVLEKFIAADMDEKAEKELEVAISFLDDYR